MALSWTFIGSAGALLLCCGIMIPVWFFTRRLSDEEDWRYAPAGPEARGRKMSQRTRIRLLVALPVFITAAIWVFTGVMADSILRSAPSLAYNSKVDFEDDQWAAGCSSYKSVNSYRFRSGSTLELRYGSFTGAKTLWRLYAGEEEEREVILRYQAEVEKGQADLVLVHPDGTVTRLSEQSSPYTFTAGAGETRLRLIGNKGKLALELTVQDQNGRWVD